MIASLVLEYMKENAHMVAAYMVLTLNSPIFMVVEPYFVGRIIEKLPSVRDGNSLLPLRTDMLAVISLYAAAQAASSGCDFTDSAFVPKLQTRLRQKLLEQVTLRSMRCAADVHVGDAIAKVAEAPFALVDLVHQLRANILPAIYTFIGAIVYLFMVHWALALLFMVSIVIFFVIVVLMARASLQIFQEAETHHDLVHEDTADVLENIQNVYDANAVDYEARRMDDHHRDLNRKAAMALRSGARLRLVANVINYLFYLAMVGLAILLFHRGLLGVGAVSTVIMVIAYVMAATGGIATELPHIVAHVAVLRKIDSFMRRLQAAAVPDPVGQGRFVSGQIVVDNVTLKLSANKILFPDGLSHAFALGRTTVVTGPIGCGKSTLLKLISGSIAATSGTVRIDGIDVAQTCTRDLRAAVVAIGQTPRLFNRTVFENIAYNDETVSVQDISDMLTRYQITFARPEQIVGKGGSRLSGGQRQIIMLLRALVRARSPQCKIVLLDEPTASLDRDSQRMAVKIIQDIVQNRTAIIVTHDQDLERLGQNQLKLK